MNFDNKQEKSFWRTVLKTISVKSYQIHLVSPSCSVLAMGFFSFVEFSLPGRSLFPSRGGVKGGCCP